MKNTRQMMAGCYILVLVFSFLSLCGCGRGYYVRGNGGYITEDRHYYRDGGWYRRDSRGNEIAVADVGIGVFVESLPPQHTTVVVQGAQYYHDGKHYYRQAPKGGYTVVAPPVAAQSRSQGDHSNRGERDR